MYLKEFNIENYGSIEKLDYKLPFDENGNPKPVVLIGKNGSGKTLLISNIIHSLIEMKKRCYNEIPEADEFHYYRLGSTDYIKNGYNYSYINYQFTDDVSFVDLATNNYDSIQNKTFKYVDMKNERLILNGFYQKTGVDSNNKQKIKDVFENNVFIYLPVDRYYSPNWLNNSNPKICINSNYPTFIEQNNDNIIKSNLLEDAEAWLLDVIIDKMLYEGKNSKRTEIVENTKIEHNYVTYQGKNSNIQTYINNLLTLILKLNNPHISSARIGITRKKGRKISIIYTLENKEYTYVPKFSNLSSGEVMILGMFISILKEYDRINNEKEIDISDLTGIAIIDEIDAHLHLDYCKEILPEIIKIFPKIQFIITSHSPFFLLGMKETFNQNCEFLNMPSGLLNDIDNFEEIKKMYELVNNDYDLKLEKLKEYEKKLKDISKTIVITEGKTDWKHLKKAKEKLNNQDDYSFFETTDVMGDIMALGMLKEQVKIYNANKRIFIFDNDNEKIVKEATTQGSNYKNWGNNVFSFVIPKPNIRNNEDKISIEHYYPDEILKKEVMFEDGISRRIYCGNDFQKTGLNPSLNKRCNKKDVCGQNIIRVLSGSEQEKVFDLDNEDNNSTNYALTKDDFFEKIINNDDNNIDMSKFSLIFDIIKEIIES